MGTFLIGSVVLGSMALVGVHLYRQYRRNKSQDGCASGCASCPYSGQCR